MSLNQYMHPRNPYRHKKPNFKALALKYAFFRSVASTTVSGKVVLDFHQPEALKALLKALTKEDFGLDLEIPADRLIPTLPLRLNYLYWVDDLLKFVRPNKSGLDITGLDIGGGASCIYGLLGCSLFNWRFFSLDVDESNLVTAQQNVDRNGLGGRVSLVRTGVEERLEDVISRSVGEVDFVMCNPPFFADDDEKESTTRSDARPQPWSVSSASTVEAVTAGGEIGFVKKIIESSLILRDKVGIYTTMLGKKSSISPLKILLTSFGLHNVATYEFCQGRTMRWGLCWIVPSADLDSLNLNTPISPASPGLTFPISPFAAERKKSKPLKMVVPQRSEEENKLSLVVWRVEQLLNEIKVEHERTKDDGNSVEFKVKSWERTWANQRQKRRAKLREMKRMQLKRTVEEDMETDDHDSHKRLKTEEDEGVDVSSLTADSGLQETCEASPQSQVAASPASVESGTGSSKEDLDQDPDMLIDADTLGNSLSETPTPILDSTLIISRSKSECIEVELRWDPGQDREILNQLLTFFKNRLK